MRAWPLARPLRRRSWAAPLLIFAVLVGLLASASMALAATPYVHYGKAGRATVYVVEGWWTWSGTFIEVPGTKVWRSPGTRKTRYRASGAQRICVQIDLWKYSASVYPTPWRIETQPRWCDTVTPGYVVTFPDWRYATQPYASYHVNVVITWHGRRGRRIGKVVWEYDNHAGDYRCLTAKCWTHVAYQNVHAIFFDF
jgi:hypothetical protein